MVFLILLIQASTSAVFPDLGASRSSGLPLIGGGLKARSVLSGSAL